MAPKKKAAEATAPVEEDVSMEEAPTPSSDLGNFGYVGPIGSMEKRIRLLPGSTETAASFEFKKEDHTLGNALRYIIMKNPEVEFCGYSIPHPSETVMNIRIQTWGTYPARDALAKGLADLIDLCDIVADKFAAARSDFQSQMQT